jgi:DnaJ-class molecular chaperone
MSVALLDRRRQRPLDGALWEEGRISGAGIPPGADLEQSGQREIESHGALTLDELIAGIWRELIVDQTVRCPVCHGRMAASVGGHGDVRGGSCLDCGTQLS